MSDGFNPQSFLERLRDIAQAAAVEAARPEPLPVSADEQRRRGRMVRAGVEDLRLIGALAPASSPPAVAGHPGSVAAFAAADAFLRDDEQRCLTLAGPTGTGKTWAAGWTAAGTDDTVWLACHEQRTLDGWTAILARAQKARLVVVNDLGAEPDWMHARLSGLVCSRQEAGRRTVITTNLAVDTSALPPERREALRSSTIEGRYGDRLLDRLLDADSVVVSCRGPSLRRSRGPA